MRKQKRQERQKRQKVFFAFFALLAFFASLLPPFTKSFDLLFPKSKYNSCGDAGLYLPPAAPQIGNDHVVLKYSESELLAQSQIYPAAARRERETRIEAPYLRAEDIAVRLD